MVKPSNTKAVLKPDPKGVYDRYVQGKTKCKLCHYPMMVNGTQEEKLADGVLITRHMKCLGPGNHRYPLKEIVKRVPIESQTGKNPPATGKNNGKKTPTGEKPV